MSKTPPLPKLAFGESKSLLQNDFDSVRDFFEAYSPSIKEIDSVIDKRDYLYKGVELNINGLSISSMATTPMYVEQYPSEEEMYIFIPLYGGCEIVAGGKKLQAIAMQKALLYTYMTHGSENSNSSFVMFKLDKKRLEFTAKTMLGEDKKRVKFHFDAPQEINLQYYKTSFLDIFLGLLKIVEECHCDERLLETIHFDDFIYRNVVLMLRPDTFLSDHTKTPKHLVSALKNILDFMEHYPDKMLSLTDLEHISGVSSRMLQYLFKKELNTTPSRFLRTQKLKKAKEILIYNHSSLSIATIAYELGFSNQSQFSKYFQVEFGFLPSEIMKK